jgi:hypothetical protein
MPEIRILDQHRVPSLDPQRKGKDDLVVTYSVNNARGYMVRVPAENATPQTIEAAVRADVALHSTVVGKTFQT